MELSLYLPKDAQEKDHVRTIKEVALFKPGKGFL